MAIFEYINGFYNPLRLGQPCPASVDQRRHPCPGKRPAPLYCLA